jgi:LEA14-like dessication related protein
LYRPARFAYVAILLSIIGLQACGSFGPGYESPTVTVSSFRAVPSESAIPDFEIGLRVINPNSQPLTLRGVAYTVSLGGHELIKGVGNDLPVIDAYGEGDLVLTASANLFAGIRLVSELISSPVEKLPYEFEAKLDTGAFRPAIRVSDVGEITLHQ